MGRIPRSEWIQLDDLLHKVGFGGYYDLMEVLKITAKNLLVIFESHQKYADLLALVEEEDDLEAIVLFIERLSSEVVDYARNKRASPDLVLDILTEVKP